MVVFWVASLACCVLATVGSPTPPTADPRYLPNGMMMLESGYLDQPYCVIDRHHGNRWVCAITEDRQQEGGPGERVLSLYSTDKGKSWSNPVPVEPNTSLTNAYLSIAITPFGRIYVMYNFNADNITTLPDGKKIGRSDELGHLVMKYSDDGSDSWSSQRYEIPYRLTSIDHNNTWNGKVKIMWSVDQSKLGYNNSLYYSFTKIGIYPQGAPEEVWFLSSSNIMSEQDASKVEWRLLPNGDHGIPPPGGNPNIAEEGHIMPLPSGAFYAVFRTTQGYLGAARSPPGEHATLWKTPSFAEYWNSTSSNSLYLKNPRGPITVKQFSNGRYLLLFYNNGDTGFDSRNPYWLSSGIVNQSGDGIMWSQPEIVLYDRDQMTRPGYPDFIEEGGAIYITETQKTIARVHEYVPTPKFPDFSQYNTRQQGFTIDMWIENHAVSSPGQVMLDSTTPSGQGIKMAVNSTMNITVGIQDDQKHYALRATDPVCTRKLLLPGLHHMAVVVDNGPFLIYFVVDGLVCDGGPTLEAGFKWISNDLSDINGSEKMVTAPTYKGTIHIGRIYTRVLFTSEVVGIFRHGFAI